MSRLWYVLRSLLSIPELSIFIYHGEIGGKMTRVPSHIREPGSLDLVQRGTRRWRLVFWDGQPGNRELGGGADFSG